LLLPELESEGEEGGVVRTVSLEVVEKKVEVLERAGEGAEGRAVSK
jgi:hypothetical protein